MKYLLLFFVIPFIVGCEKPKDSEPTVPAENIETVDAPEKVTASDSATPTGD